MQMEELKNNTSPPLKKNVNELNLFLQIKLERMSEDELKEWLLTNVIKYNNKLWGYDNASDLSQGVFND